MPKTKLAETFERESRNDFENIISVTKDDIKAIAYPSNLEGSVTCDYLCSGGSSCGHSCGRCGDCSCACSCSNSYSSSSDGNKIES